MLSRKSIALLITCFVFYQYSILVWLRHVVVLNCLTAVRHIASKAPKYEQILSIGNHVFSEKRQK